MGLSFSHSSSSRLKPRQHSKLWTWFDPKSRVWSCVSGSKGRKALDVVVICVQLLQRK